MTEKSIQEALYWDCVRYNHRLIVPNIYYYDWESDLIAVTRGGLVHEFEIKISKSDFRADAKKKRGAALSSGKGPSYFWYVCPCDLIKPEELPPYAGLIYCSPYEGRHHSVSHSHKAPRLHRNKPDSESLLYLAEKMIQKYWRLRMYEVISLF